MIRIYIELDKEKMEQEGVYSYEKMQKYIEDRIVAHGGYKDTDGWYTNGTWEGFGALAAVWERSNWFMDNVKKWLWNNKDYDDESGDACIEDLLEEIKKERSRQP